MALHSIFTALSIFCCILFPGIAASQTQSQQKTTVETKSKTVVDMTAEELRHSYRSQLSNLQIDLNQDELGILLKEVGDRVEAFFRDFSNTSSKEQVLLQRLGPDRKPWYSSKKEYYYFILPHGGNAGISWKEERTDLKLRPVSQKGLPGLCISSGYAFLCLYLHPNHQAGSHFRYLGREISGTRAHVIAFAQKPEVGDYLASYYDGTLSLSTRLLVQGFAWLDPDNYQIVHMWTSLLAPEKKTFLQEQTTDIYYTEVSFDGVQQSFWLPHEVIVNWKSPNQIYCNQHRYSDYRLFTVETDYKITQPPTKK